MNSARQNQHALERAVTWKIFEVQAALYSENATDTDLSDCVIWLQPRHYCEIIEERVTANMCGYPLCRNNIHYSSSTSNSPTYRISYKEKKIFEVGDSKCYCSEHCQEVSHVFSASLSNTAPIARKCAESLSVTYDLDSSADKVLKALNLAAFKDNVVSTAQKKESGSSHTIPLSKDNSQSNSNDGTPNSGDKTNDKPKRPRRQFQHRDKALADASASKNKGSSSLEVKNSNQEVFKEVFKEDYGKESQNDSKEQEEPRQDEDEEDEDEAATKSDHNTQNNSNSTSNSPSTKSDNGSEDKGAPPAAGDAIAVTYDMLKQLNTARSSAGAAAAAVSSAREPPPWSSMTASGGSFATARPSAKSEPDESSMRGLTRVTQPIPSPENIGKPGLGVIGGAPPTTARIAAAINSSRTAEEKQNEQDLAKLMKESKKYADSKMQAKKIPDDRSAKLNEAVYIDSKNDSRENLPPPPKEATEMGVNIVAPKKSVYGKGNIRMVPGRNKQVQWTDNALNDNNSPDNEKGSSTSKKNAVDNNSSKEVYRSLENKEVDMTANEISIPDFEAQADTTPIIRGIGGAIITAEERAEAQKAAAAKARALATKPPRVIRREIYTKQDVQDPLKARLSGSDKHDSITSSPSSIKSSKSKSSSTSSRVLGSGIVERLDATVSPRPGSHARVNGSINNHNNDIKNSKTDNIINGSTTSIEGFEPMMENVDVRVSADTYMKGLSNTDPFSNKKEKNLSESDRKLLRELREDDDDEDVNDNNSIDSDTGIDYTPNLSTDTNSDPQTFLKLWALFDDVFERDIFDIGLDVAAKDKQEDEDNEEDLIDGTVGRAKTDHELVCIQRLRSGFEQAEKQCLLNSVLISASDSDEYKGSKEQLIYLADFRYVVMELDDQEWLVLALFLIDILLNHSSQSLLPDAKARKRWDSSFNMVMAGYLGGGNAARSRLTERQISLLRGYFIEG